ncbi:DUF7168 domain-containing protein [[Eubacterium] cellulosolvens]
MAYTPEQILKKVQKLLKLANNKAASEGERDNAMRQAHKFLAKYNLDLADVDAANAEETRQAKGEPREEHTHRFYGRPWARHAASAVGRLFFCDYLYVSHKKATDVKHYFIGRRSNAITASLMAEFVVKSIMREGKRQQREFDEDNGWFRAFCWGASHKVSDRVNKLIAGEDESQTTEAPGTALVLASYYEQERAANQLMIRQLHPALRKGRGGKGYAYGGDAYSRGKAYGSTVSLNRQVK